MLSTKLLLLVGSGLIALPVISEAIRVKQFVDLAAVVVRSSGSANFLPAPTIWYAISALTGAVLIAISLVLGLRARKAHLSADGLQS